MSLSKSDQDIIKQIFIEESNKNFFSKDEVDQLFARKVEVEEINTEIMTLRELITEIIRFIKEEMLYIDKRIEKKSKK